MTERDLDVVVFGATGVTGRRVAAYLAEQGAADRRALGGCRRAIRASSSACSPRTGCRRAETIVADLGDPTPSPRWPRARKTVLNLCRPVHALRRGR